MMSASSTLLPRQRAGWVAAKASWWRTVCCCYCHRPHCLATIAVRPVSWRSRWQPLYYAATPGPQPRLMTNRELTVSAVCLREDGGRESNATYHTEPAKEGDQSFEKENIWTIPNVLSLSRILLSPVLGYQVLQGNYMMAFGLLIVAAVSDVVDGQIARHYPSQSSMLGSVLDPFADKCLVSVLCVALTVRDLFPLPLTVIILSRDILLIGAALYIRYSTLPPPRTWARYWDIQRSTLQVTPSSLSKINTLLQLSAVGVSLGAALVSGASHHPLLQALWVMTAVSTVTSGANYFIQMEGFRILRKKG